MSELRALMAVFRSEASARTYTDTQAYTHTLSAAAPLRSAERSAIGELACITMQSKAWIGPPKQT